MRRKRVLNLWQSSNEIRVNEENVEGLVKNERDEKKKTNNEVEDFSKNEITGPESIK